MDEHDETNDMARLQTWKANVAESGFKEYQTLVKTLDEFMYGIHNYFKYHLTNTGSEGFNNKVNLIKRRSYGFQNIEYFMLKILRLCGKPSSCSPSWRPAPGFSGMDCIRTIRNLGQPRSRGMTW